MSDFFERLAKSVVVGAAKRIAKKVLRKEVKPKSTKEPEVELKPKAHPWRQCPIGEHWVIAHPMKVPSSNKNPHGVTERDGHCALNPKRNRRAISDYIESDEIYHIEEKYFRSLTGAPKADDLDYENGNKYDHLIRGWTKYWNEVLRPEVALDPNLVKALIGSESSFNASPKPQNAGAAGKARGLIQLTDQAVKVLSQPNAEIKDHYVKLSKEDTLNPRICIPAGIRWLFHKKRLASGKLGREATWEEAIAEYKAYTKAMKAGNHMKEEGMIVIDRLYKRLQK